MDNSRDMDRGYGPPRGGNHGGNHGGNQGGNHGGSHGGNSGGNSNSGAGGKKAKIFVRNVSFDTTKALSKICTSSGLEPFSSSSRASLTHLCLRSRSR